MAPAILLFFLKSEYIWKDTRQFHYVWESVASFRSGGFYKDHDFRHGVQILILSHEAASGDLCVSYCYSQFFYLPIFWYFVHGHK